MKYAGLGNTVLSSTDFCAAMTQDRNHGLCKGMLTAILLSVVAFQATAQSARQDKASAPKSPPLVQSMPGEWTVRQRMWQAAGQDPTDLPPAVAHRRLLGGTILQEQMELAPGENSDPFTRMSYFEYNLVTRQYEYFSIDSRAPQMMNERSYGDVDKQRGDEPLNLWGGMFVAPKWGDAANATFRYRISIGPVQQNRQIVQLYLTPISGEPAKEFLAFEYTYTRIP